MDLYTRNILVGVFAVLVMGTVIVGEMISWAHCDIDSAKDMVQKISLGVSSSGTLFLAFAYFKGSRQQKKKDHKKSALFSHDYHGPKLKVKR